jgi:hypothetical protein
MNNYDEAKKIYFHYNGSYFFMDREGDYEKYQSFNVPRFIEEKWDEEIKKNIISDINKEMNVRIIVSLCRKLISISADKIYNNIDICGLKFVSDVLNNNKHNFDTFTKLILIELMFNKLYSKNFFKADSGITKHILQESLEYLKQLSKEQITISSDYPKEHEIENIKKRILEDIIEYTKLYEEVVKGTGVLTTQNSGSIDDK